MSSSNRVRVAFITESTYGETPVAGNFNTARFTSESLSGTPETTESQQIRTDRQSSGQIVTGLTVNGDLNMELAKETAIDLLMQSAMFQSAWTTDTPVTVDYDIDTVAGTITRDSGDFNADVVVGDVLTLSGNANSENNTQVMVLSINSTTEISYAGPDTMVDETGSGNSFKVADKMDIGTTQVSFSMEKAFLDLTEKAINYRGMLVSSMNVSAAYGSPISATFSLSGNDYEPVDAAADFMTDGRTITAAATTQSMNGSVDMKFIANSATGTFEESSFCIQSVNITLNNNLTARNCIGRTAPLGYSEGQASIEVSLSAYLADGNWSLLASKLAQTPFKIGFILKNDNGFYGFYMPAVQVSFPDPASAGGNQDVIMSMTGTAKIGSAGESELTIFRG